MDKDSVAEMMTMRTQIALGPQKPSPPAPASESSGIGNLLLGGLGLPPQSLLPGPEKETPPQGESMLMQFLKNQK